MFGAAYATYHDTFSGICGAGEENVQEGLHCDGDNCGRVELDSTQLYALGEHDVVCLDQ